MPGCARHYPRRGAAALALAALFAGAGGARAGTLTHEALAQAFPAPYLVGERDMDLPVWPLFRKGGPPAFALELVGYLFESVDLAPVPGFAGTPVDLLVAMSAGGEFLDVQVVSHHEPVFLGGVGREPLLKFVAQYKGLSLKQNIKIGAGAEQARGGSTNAYVDGVAKATASIRIINQSILYAALRVARAKLGYGGRDPDLVAHVKADLLEPHDWAGLERVGLVQHLRLTNREVEQAFSGTPAAGADGEGLAQPDGTFLELWAAMATVPTAGRTLLTDAAWAAMGSRINPGDHVLLVMSRGRASFIPEDFVRNSVPDRLSLRQSGLALELRDLDLVDALRPSGGPPVDAWMAFRVLGQAGLDPGAPMRLSVRVTRARGQIYPERTSRDFALELAIPERFLFPASEDEKGWVSSWKARKAEIALLLLALAFLSAVLARPSSLVARAARLRWFRPAFLAFTLAFVGWYAQGQLSIVNLVALLQAALAGRSWAFFLYDPMSTLLWGYTLATLAIWGRGTFCGWLCPFGALQELAALLARAAGLPRIRLSIRADRRLKRVKYGVLALVLGAAAASVRWGDAAVEVEPFKTAITVVFARSWPFVAYAVGIVALGAAVPKAFCRYACPLGAALAVAGRLRRFDWIRRRAECGRPCQTCRSRCEYQAIDPGGRIDYAECFQCMDCAAVFQSDELCAPRILLRKGRKPMMPTAARRPAER